MGLFKNELPPLPEDRWITEYRTIVRFKDREGTFHCFDQGAVQAIVEATPGPGSQTFTNVYLAGGKKVVVAGTAKALAGLIFPEGNAHESS